MNELQTVIEGYNKEKVELGKVLYNSSGYFRNGVKERLREIDENIERLLTLKYYPDNK